MSTSAATAPLALAAQKADASAVGARVASMASARA